MIHYQTWTPQAILVSDWLIFFKSSPLKPLVIEDLPYILSTKFQFIRESGFRGEYFLEINQSETRMVCGGHGC
jgi:hypothetical protein